MLHEIAHLGLLDDEAITPDTAALEIAGLDHPDADLTDYAELLSEMTERLLARAVTAHSAEEQASALTTVLAVEFGLEGDRDTYDDPANADMIRVLERRRGLPVALAILYVAIGRRVGWEVYALNTPGHVVVGLRDDGELILIDPFNRGARMSADGLSALLERALGRAGPFPPEHLAPMTNRGALLRLLMNQASRAEQGGDSDRARTVFQRITTVAPAYSFGWWERARLELASGEPGAARESLSAMLETTRDPALRMQVNAALDALA
jgi:regulator of sirC expression with transglutaminase-like and TPR domain